MLRSHHSGDHMADSTQDIDTEKLELCRIHPTRVSRVAVTPPPVVRSLSDSRPQHRVHAQHEGLTGAKLPLWDLAWTGHWILFPGSHIYIVLYV